MDESKLTALTADVVAAYVANHRLSPQEVPELITGVGQAIWQAAAPTPVAEPEVRAKRTYTRRRYEEQQVEQEPDSTVDDVTGGDVQGEDVPRVLPEPMFED